MVAGIDGAGTVLESSHAGLEGGRPLRHNGWGVGETRWGCLAERARLKGDWLVRLPPAFTTRQAMAIGTAGYTAMLCVLALERHGVSPGDGEVLVTGATGGVGSIAVALARAASATASSPRPARRTRPTTCSELGAAEMIDRAELRARRQAAAEGALGRRRSTRSAATRWPTCWRRRATAASSRPAAWRRARPAGTVMPFILRGVTLAGIDSVMAPIALRAHAWERLARDLDPKALDLITEEVPLDGAIAKAEALMAGRVRGRIVVATGGVRPGGAAVSGPAATAA